MVALFFFLLALFVSPFKSKIWLEAGNAALRQSTDRVAAEGEGTCPTHERRAPVLDPVVSLVSFGLGGDHDRPA
jgi:hypothetical protein